MIDILSTGPCACGHVTHRPATVADVRLAIETARTPAGGWTQATLARFGVDWPPPRGWRARLERSPATEEARRCATCPCVVVISPRS